MLQTPCSKPTRPFYRPAFPLGKNRQNLVSKRHTPTPLLSSTSLHQKAYQKPPKEQARALSQSPLLACPFPTPLELGRWKEETRRIDRTRKRTVRKHSPRSKAHPPRRNIFTPPPSSRTIATSESQACRAADCVPALASEPASVWRSHGEGQQRPRNRKVQRFFPCTRHAGSRSR